MLTAREVMQMSKIIPVISVHSEDEMLHVADALIEGGVSIFEITLRTPEALKAIEAVAKAFPEACTGAGTVLNTQMLKSVEDVGAKFAISPGLTPSLAQAYSDEHIPLLPGVATASEIMSAMEYGFDAFKLFPATAVGGIELLKSLSGPFKDAVFCPTGGINASNASDFLKLANVLCIGGSWIVPKELIEYGKYYEITRLTKEARELLHCVEKD